MQEWITRKEVEDVIFPGTMLTSVQQTRINVPGRSGVTYWKQIYVKKNESASIRPLL